MATSLSQLYDHVHFFSQPSDNGHYVSTLQEWTPPCHYHTIMATSLSQLYDHVHFFSQPSDNGHYVSTLQAWIPPCHYHTIMATSLSQTCSSQTPLPQKKLSPIYEQRIKKSNLQQTNAKK